MNSRRKSSPSDAVAPGATVLSAAHSILGRQYRMFGTARTGMLEGNGAEALHDMRVALSRFSTGLRLFRPFLSDIGRKGLNRLMSKFRCRLGAARDSEVWLAFLLSVSRKKDRARDATWTDYLSKQTRRHQTLRRGVVRLLSGTEYARLEHMVGLFLGAELSKRVADTPAASFEKYVAGRLRRGYRRLVKRKVRSGRASPEQMHALRKKCRMLRYRAEFASPVLGGTVKRLAANLKAVTTSLGDVHDMDVYLERITSERCDTPAGLESAIRRRRAAAMRRFREAWDELGAERFRKRLLTELGRARGKG